MKGLLRASWETKIFICRLWESGEDRSLAQVGLYEPVLVSVSSIVNVPISDQRI